MRWASVLVLPVMVAVAALALTPDGGDCDGTVATDLPARIARIFGDSPVGCAIDANDDGRIGVADIVALLLFLGATPPAVAASGPIVTFAGLAGADGAAINPLGSSDEAPVFFRNTGSGFLIVVEGRAGLSGRPPSVTVFNTDRGDSSKRPDLQVESSTPLGDGSSAVCDGGVPAVEALDYGPAQSVANALNDLACHFVPATSPSFACTQDVFGRPLFRDRGTQVQFCLQVAKTLEFAAGETVLSVRLRDTAGNLGPLQRLILRVGTGPGPPTFTPRPTVPSTRTATPTATFTTRASATALRSATPSLTPTSTQTLARSSTPTVSPTPTPTATRPPTATASATIPPTPTHTATSTATVTHTQTPSPTRTKTWTPSVTATPTPTATAGPVITFLGVTRSDDTLVSSSGTTADEAAIYTRPAGAGFSLVIEGRPGTNGAAVGRSAYQRDLTSFPDLQIQVSRPLGDGSAAVCDRSGPTVGGVPAVDPPSFEPSQTNIDTINDFACRFLDGAGQPLGRSANDACVLFSSGDFRFVNRASRVQFCGFIGRPVEFPPGDTLITVRLRAEDGSLGPRAQVVIHIGP